MVLYCIWPTVKDVHFVGYFLRSQQHKLTSYPSGGIKSVDGVVGSCKFCLHVRGLVRKLIAFMICLLSNPG